MSSPTSGQLRQWVVEQGRACTTRNRHLAAHFAEDDREDGTFHAGVLTALEGMAVYPKKHWLTKKAGFFNDDGYWDPAGLHRLRCSSPQAPIRSRNWC